ncbi:MAG TPA: ATPase, T2SS/T4P/T4SS family, partial [Pirellulaceae bacterium]|nr:ATPase, T2SS/T4P/T4SS family [Pirellulaceae bacterium]
LQAMNTGHDGSLTTIHANSAQDALSRMEMMVAMTGYEVPVTVIREYIASGINLIMHVARLAGGIRRVMQVSEIVFENGNYRIEDIFGFEQTGVDNDGVAVGEFYTTGHKPSCLQRIQAAGVTLSEDLFRPQRFACANDPTHAGHGVNAQAIYVTR